MSNNVEMKKEERYSRVPKFNPRQMDKWELFLKAHLKRDQAESALTEVKPTVDADKQATLHGDAEEGELSKDERIYLKWVKQEEEKWLKKNAIAYSAIVESCGEHAGAMVVILGRQGNDNAKELFDALMRKYRVQSTAILQMELAHFHGMVMGSSESGLDYIDRIENSKVKLIQMGHHALIDDVDLVGRLVVGMRNNSKYVGLSDTFRMVRDLTWQYAVEQVTVFDTQSSSNLQTTSVKAHMVKHKPFKKGGRNKVTSNVTDVAKWVISPVIVIRHTLLAKIPGKEPRKVGENLLSKVTIIPLQGTTSGVTVDTSATLMITKSGNCNAGFAVRTTERHSAQSVMIPRPVVQLTRIQRHDRASLVHLHICCAKPKISNIQLRKVPPIAMYLLWILQPLFTL